MDKLFIYIISSVIVISGVVVGSYVYKSKKKEKQRELAGRLRKQLQGLWANLIMLNQNPVLKPKIYYHKDENDDLDLIINNPMRWSQIYKQNVFLFKEKHSMDIVFETNEETGLINGIIRSENIVTKNEEWFDFSGKLDDSNVIIELFERVDTKTGDKSRGAEKKEEPPIAGGSFSLSAKRAEPSKFKKCGMGCLRIYNNYLFWFLNYGDLDKLPQRTFLFKVFFPKT